MQLCVNTLVVLYDNGVSEEAQVGLLETSEIFSHSPAALMLWCVLAATGAFAASENLSRFHGFRFELPMIATSTDEWLENIASKARDHACFGWVQATPQRSVVGEVRCGASYGPHVQSWLERASSDSTPLVYVYPSTQIRYHFSSFRILEPSRRTCFHAPPHACANLPASSSTAAALKDEL
ncbi:Aste57867_2097 [Aphanomyces stellatus]|uniref:Aste57867_2097 protein n=1 Tax=Aphanomyces stellatus TaxID=120398 RepID=A0A485K7U1_9STRA|nr:hypothetical protein As57867_002092 [Aphanomyces stellatus]VFT79300.1 Aste57867_2097 [Aphanomyces stellatus]